jgi:hypothetical protein
MGFFTIEGSNDYGKTWVEEITEPATDIRQATVLLRQDLDRTCSVSLAKSVLTLWDQGRGEAVVSDKGISLLKDPIQWRYRYTEN